MTNEELFLIINEHLINDEKPSLYLRDLIENKSLGKGKFNILKKLKHINQEPKHHPEGNVLNHTMQVIDEASKLRDFAKNKQEFMWAALFHDLGKITTTKVRKGRVTSYNHDNVGGQISLEILKNYSNNEKFNLSVSSLVRHHMIYLYLNKNLPFGDIDDMIKNTNIIDLVLLTLSDRLGRGEISKSKKDEIVKSLEEFIRIVERKKDIQLNEVKKILIIVSNNKSKI